VATELQYGIFKSLYDEEAERYSELEGRAKIYFSVLSLYLGFLAFKIDDVRKFSDNFHVPIWLFLAGGFILVVSLLVTVLAIRIMTYEGLFDPEEVLEDSESWPAKDADFLDDRIVDLAIATNRNSNQNNRTANVLSVSALLLFVGVVFHLVVFAVALLQSSGG
jgi:hypothetical protein